MRKQMAFLIAVLGLPATMLAQFSAPPVKMGLWQGTNTVVMTGLQIPPDVAARLQAMGRPLPTGEPHTVTMQSCLTADKWKNMFSHLQQGKQNCQFTNVHQGSEGVSLDLTCKSANDRYHSTGHIEMTFDSPEKMHGKAHIETIAPSQPNPIMINMTFDDVYQGADCQGISPDSPKLLR